MPFPSLFWCSVWLLFCLIAVCRTDLKIHRAGQYFSEPQTRQMASFKY